MLTPPAATASTAARALQQARRAHGREHYERLFAFQCRSLRLPDFKAQSAWAKAAMGRKWTADFHFPEYALLVEIDGGVWRPGGGAHSRPGNIERDIEKHNAAVLLGLTTLRFTPKHVTSGDAVAITQRVLAARGWKGPNHKELKDEPGNIPP